MRSFIAGIITTVSGGSSSHGSRCRHDPTGASAKSRAGLSRGSQAASLDAGSAAKSLRARIPSHRRQKAWRKRGAKTKSTARVTGSTAAAVIASRGISRDDLWRTIPWVRHLAHLTPSAKADIEQQVQPATKKHEKTMEPALSQPQ
jgi:hypothetical protein